MSDKVYKIITDRILSMLKAGVNPWEKPWKPGTTSVLDHNGVSHKAYHGVNSLVLPGERMVHGYGAPIWLTYNQARKMGGNVRKGEKGAPVVFWKFLEVIDKHDPDGQRTVTIPMLRYFSVFNIDQTEEVQLPKVETTEQPETVIPEGLAQTIVDGFSGPTIKHVGDDRAYYVPSTDMVIMPRPDQFTSEEQYYATMYHELGHSTGHDSRLNRDMKAYKRDERYSREEFVAELCSAFLCSHVDIDNNMQNAAYLKSWTSKLSDNPKWLVWASSRAESAAKYILGVD